MPVTHFAHTIPEASPENWEPLADHLHDVAELAAAHAARFGAREWGELVGRWHDLGKYSGAFQDYLRTENGLDPHFGEVRGRVDHSTAGARHAAESLGPLGKLLAYVIAGHHAGLANDVSNSRSDLDHRLNAAKQAIPEFDAPAEILDPTTGFDPQVSLGELIHADPDGLSFQLATFVRMLFSALVDADFLATEAFLIAEQRAIRERTRIAIDAMQTRLNEHLAKFVDSGRTDDVYECRQEVLGACRVAAAHEPGLFSLTVPTGGGKTFASLAFALDHAVRHGFDRVVYAIPFTSIVEQTANVFRDVFAELDPDAVLEHHSNLDSDDPRRQNRRSRLAAENWDAPLVVTTNVQFFESLFAARTSKCRKLHRLAGSVVILDEAQTIPVELLEPCLAILRELARNYRCSIVLCTATQPAFTKREPFFEIGFEPGLVREIVPEPTKLYERMRRVEVEHVGPLPDDGLVDRLADCEQVLCIVNTKPHAAAVFAGLLERLPDDEATFHLSTRLCGQHRADVLDTIRKRLDPENRRPCRVVSTQLIEAGVDIDFPVVYRALAGIDSIAQAAGRCNREGRLERGHVFVFEPPDVRLIGYLASTANTTRELLPDYFEDLLDLDAVRRYFELLYSRNKDDHGRWDHRRVMEGHDPEPNRLSFQFRQIAERFRMIPEETRPILVPFDDRARDLIERLRAAPPNRYDLRRLQRYTVGVREREYAEWIATGNAELLHDEHAVLVNVDAYDEQLGLRADRIGYMAVDTSIV